MTSILEFCMARALQESLVGIIILRRTRITPMVRGMIWSVIEKYDPHRRTVSQKLSSSLEIVGVLLGKVCTFILSRVQKVSSRKIQKVSHHSIHGIFMD